jgi:hypothetical protein
MVVSKSGQEDLCEFALLAVDANEPLPPSAQLE